MRRNLVEQEDSFATLDEPAPPASSLDSEIDSRIVRYESESLESEEEKESANLLESLRHLSLKFLFEQDEPADAAAPEQQQAAPAPEKPEEEERLPINMNVFASKIARLVEHAEELLPVREVILTRTMKYLRDNYDQSYADQLEDILDQQYGFDLSGEEDVIDVPIAAGAGTKSAGG